MNEEELKKLLERVESIETSIKEKDTKIAELEKTNSELNKKIATLKVDSLTRDVSKDEQPKVEEEITFDFDF